MPIIDQTIINDLVNKQFLCEPPLFENEGWKMSKSVGVEPKDLIVGAASAAIFLNQYTTRLSMNPVTWNIC